MSDFIFEKIIPTDEQIIILHELLNKREHNISNMRYVTFESHKAFVCNHPYRDWFFVKLEEANIGNVYVTHENTIGINIENYGNIKAISAILHYVKEHYPPLEAIPSIRSSNFAINVSPTNHLFAKTLRSLGAEMAQITFYFP